MFDILVVGAGPAGCKTAELCSKYGLDVLLIDKKNKVGSPVQCTGLFSHRIYDVSGVSSTCMVNKVSRARFYSPDGNFLELKSDTPTYVFDRQKFDQELFKMAKKAGAKTMLNTEFVDYMNKGSYLEIKTSRGVFEAKILVGADGSNSRVAKKAGLPVPEDFVVGYQETLKHKYDPKTVELWFGKGISPDFFAWVVPLDKNHARVGVATKKNVSKYFNEFIKLRLGKYPKKANPEGGVIMRGLIKKSVSDRVLLVGDAASQVKPYSGGGVVYGQIASKIAADACYLAVKRSNFTEGFLKQHYEKRWKKRLSSGIRKGFLIDRITHLLPDWSLNFGVSASKKLKFWLEKIDMDLI